MCPSPVEGGVTLEGGGSEQQNNEQQSYRSKAGAFLTSNETDASAALMLGHSCVRDGVLE